MPGWTFNILLHIVWFTFVFQSAAVLHSSNTYRCAIGFFNFEIFLFIFNSSIKGYC
jgi:hypothetical protein